MINYCINEMFPLEDFMYLNQKKSQKIKKTLKYILSDR